jgi:hypothetical protein
MTDKGAPGKGKATKGRSSVTVKATDTATSADNQGQKRKSEVLAMQQDDDPASSESGQDERSHILLQRKVNPYLPLPLPVTSRLAQSLAL